MRTFRGTIIKKVFARLFIMTNNIRFTEIPGGSLELFLEFLELLPGLLATRSRLLRELFCLGLLHLVQLHHLFLTCWHTITSLRLWLILISFFPS